MAQVKNNAEKTNFSLTSDSSKLGDERLYDSYFINEYGRLETLRSERYGNAFSVIVIHVESFYNGKKTPSRKGLLEFLKILVRTTNKVIRGCDIAGILEDKRVILILPHTAYFDSLITIRKLARALKFCTKTEPYATIIYSQATYPKDANGYGELVAVATRRIQERLDSLLERLDFRGELFWEMAAALTGNELEEQDSSTFYIGADHDLPNSFIDTLNTTILQEVARNHSSRGILYMGVKKYKEDLPIISSLHSINKTNTKIYIVGQGEDKKKQVGPATALLLADNRLLNTYFTLFFNEDTAYAIFCNESWGDAHSCFHTSDPYIVEALIEKFQQDYSLQERL